MQARILFCFIWPLFLVPFYWVAFSYCSYSAGSGDTPCTFAWMEPIWQVMILGLFAAPVIALVWITTIIIGVGLASRMLAEERAKTSQHHD